MTRNLLISIVIYSACDIAMDESALINFANVPTGEFRGVSTEELNFFSIESASRYLFELDDEFLEQFNEHQCSSEENGEIDEGVQAEMNRLEEESVSTHTKWNTQSEVKKFKDFLLENKLCVSFETVPASVLNNYLRFYYFSLKKKDGSCFAPSTLIGKRAAIHRYLNSPQVNRNINILQDREFTRANSILKCMVGKSIKSGRKEMKYPGIEMEDLQKIGTLFNGDFDQYKLQQFVWFQLSFKLGLRGRELHHQMKRSWLAIDTDASGRRFCHIKVSYLSKNVKASLRQKEYENLADGKIYDDLTNPEMCPVMWSEKYINCLHSEDLYPQPSRSAKLSDMTTWYCKTQRCSKDYLGKMLPTISENAGCSRVYTNHSLRVGCVSVLNEAGFGVEEIASISGKHANCQ